MIPPVCFLIVYTPYLFCLVYCSLSSQIIYCLWKKKNKSVGDSWRMDETYIKVKGKWHYLYRAIDSSGMTLDIWLRKNRDKQAAYAFFKRLIKQFGEPRVLVTDKAPSLRSAFNQLKSEGEFTYTSHRTSNGMATVFLTNFIRCRTSFRMLFRLSLTMSLLGCDDLRQELTVKVRLPR